jgi:phosphotransferase system HPr-like phosphotransfer protein
VQKANEFPCEITIWKGEEQGNAKSISHLINLKIRQDDLVRLKATGSVKKRP